MTTILNILTFIRKMRKSLGPNLRLNYFSILFCLQEGHSQAAPPYVSATNAAVQGWFLVDFGINREQRLILVLEDS